MLEIMLLLMNALMLCPVAFFWAGCPCCVSCNSVCSGSGATSFQIVATGISDAHCTGCSSANSTYIVSYEPNPLLSGCFFRTRWTSNICRTEVGAGSPSTATVELYIWRYTSTFSQSPIGLTPVIGNYYMRVNIGVCAYANGNAVSFERDLGSTLPDCSSFSNLSLTWDGGDLAGSGGQCFAFDPGLHCDGSGATCEVTSL